MKIREFLKDELAVKPGSVKIPIKSMVDQYRERYEALRKEKRFMHEVYRIMPGDRIIVHVKVPSESLKSFYYDVLLELDKGAIGVTKIDDCDVHIFSNCPSFVYRYAYVFYHLDLNTDNSAKKKKKNGMLIDMFTSKIPKDRLLIDGSEDKYGGEVLNNEPVIRNSLGLPLFDKSLYYAIFYLQTVPIVTIFSTRRTITEKRLFDSISSFDYLMALRKQEENREKRAAAREQKAAEKQVKEVERRTASLNRTTGVHKPLKPKSTASMSKPRKPSGVRHIGGN